MDQYPISNKGTGKVFESRILERLTRTHFAFPVTLYYVIAAASIGYAIYLEQNLWQLLYLFPLGLLTFTLVEYLIHRFLFHFDAQSEKEVKIKYSIHGVHHAYPKDKDRLAMPPIVSLGLAGFFFVIFFFTLGEKIWLFYPGFVAGYSTYLIIHYAVHRYRQPNNFLRYLWKHHSLHHYKSDDYAFSVSFPIWDVIFGTMPTASAKKDALAGNKLPDYNE